MDTPDPPPAPNPFAVAGAQTGSNIGTAIANTVLGNANQQTPWGNVDYSQTGNFTTITDPATGQVYNVPQYNVTTTLSPEQAAQKAQTDQLKSSMLGIGQAQVGRIGDVLGTPIDPNSLPAAVNAVGSGPQFQGAQSTPILQSHIPFAGNIYNDIADSGPITRGVNLSEAPTEFGQTAGGIRYGVGPQDGFSADRLRVEQALMDRLNPQLDRDREALRTRLSNQGLTEGTTAFNTAMDLANRQALDARLGAVLAGGQEQSRLYDLALSQGQFANAAQQQDFGQQQARGLFGMNAIGQNNAARLAAGNFANAAQGQHFGQNAEALRAINAAQAQRFGQYAAGADLYNQAHQQDYQNRQNAANVQNALAQQAFGNQLTGAQFANTARERALQEQLALRNQPINEISALMSGAQVSMPQFAQYRPGSVAGTDLAGAIYNSAALDQQNYGQQMAQNNAMMGGLFGLGSAGLLGLGSKSRLVA